MTKAQTRLQLEGKWWVAHEALMGYEQSRPVPVAKIKARARCNSDCSGSIYGIWWALGFADPTGGEYTRTDVVYTGTLLSANDRIPGVTPGQLQVGDLVIYGTTESTHHVCFVLEPGSDPLLFSHGQSRGPIAVRLSDETAWHRANGHPVVSFRRTELPGDTAEPPRWKIVNGTGDVLARTKRPAIWAARHPKMFRKFRHIRYERIG